jgi:hypothetical protein
MVYAPLAPQIKAPEDAYNRQNGDGLVWIQHHHFRYAQSVAKKVLTDYYQTSGDALVSTMNAGLNFLDLILGMYKANLKEIIVLEDEVSVSGMFEANSVLTVLYDWRARLVNEYSPILNQAIQTQMLDELMPTLIQGLFRHHKCCTSAILAVSTVPFGVAAENLIDECQLSEVEKKSFSDFKDYCEAVRVHHRKLWFYEVLGINLFKS